MKKRIKEIVRAQCDQCGLVGDRKEYTDGTYQTRCPHCGRKSGYKVIK